MGKASLAQEKRDMVFEEGCGVWTERRLTQEDAAELLGVCPRTFRRWTERYEEDGVDGLRDRRLSGASHRAAPVDEVMRMVDRYRTRHEGWSVRHFYAWYRRDGAVLFFQLINARHERASTVLTSNKGFEEWGGVLGDEVMTAALIDRLLHHCHIVNIRGNSYRMRERQDLLRPDPENPHEATPA